jgi:hypothetical protein
MQYGICLARGMPAFLALILLLAGCQSTLPTSGAPAAHAPETPATPAKAPAAPSVPPPEAHTTSSPSDPDKVSTSESEIKLEEAPRVGSAATSDDKSEAPHSPSLISITPFSDLTQDFEHPHKPSDKYSGAYTRLRIVAKHKSDVDKGKSTTPPQKTTQLPYLQRNWLRRFFVGLHTSTNFTIKVSAGAYTATVPLVTIDHVSTKTDGESFTRIVYHQAENYPLFLIKRDGSNGIISIKATVKISNQVSSGAAGAALEIAQSVIKEVAPQSTVLTTLTQQSATNKANAIDTAVNKLFASSVDEEQWTDSDVRLWKNGVSIKFAIPSVEGVWDGEHSGSLNTLGTWTVHFANPRPSIFSDIDICAESEAKLAKQQKSDIRCRLSFDEAAAEVEAEIHPTDVLAFKLIDGGNELGSIDAFIKKQDWYTTAIKAFSSTTPAPSASTATDFCRSIKSSMASLNLNYIDQGIIAHSAVAAMAIPDAGYALLKDEPECQCATLPVSGNNSSKSCPALPVKAKTADKATAPKAKEDKPTAVKPTGGAPPKTGQDVRVKATGAQRSSA